MEAPDLRTPARLRRHLSALLVVLAAVTFAPPAPAQAQDGGPSATWGIAPASADGPDGRARLEHLLEPGSTTEDHVLVRNFGDEPLELSVYAADATTTEEGGFDIATDAERALGVGAWVQLESSDITVPAREAINVPFTIELPANATPGDHAGGIVAVRRSSGSGATAGLDTEHRVGTRVYLRVAGTIDASLDITGLRADHHGSWNPAAGGRTSIDFDVENTGNIRLSGPLTVTVQGPFGLGRRTQQVAKLDDVLPGHTVRRTAEIEGVAPLGPLHVEVSSGDLTSAGQDLTGDIGPFTATTRVWAPPFPQLILLGVVTAAVLWQRRSKRRRRTRDASGSKPTDAADPASAATLETV